MTGPGFVAALAVSRHLLCYLLLPVKCISQAVVVLPGLGASASGPPALGRGVLRPAVCQGAASGHYHTPGRSSPGQLPSTKAHGLLMANTGWVSSPVFSWGFLWDSFKFRSSLLPPRPSCS